MKTNLKKALGISMVTILFVTVLGYSYYRTEDFLKGPVLEVSTPKDGEVFADSPLINVLGTSKNLAFLNIDGRKIFTDKEGNWAEKLLLHPGLNIIETQATDRFGREIKKSGRWCTMTTYRYQYTNAYEYTNPAKDCQYTNANDSRRRHSYIGNLLKDSYH